VRARKILSRARLKWILAVRGRKTVLWFAIALFLLASIAAVSYVQTRSLLASTSWVFRTHQTLFSLERLLSDAEQVESCHHKYVLYREQVYLTCFQGSSQRIAGETATLRELTKDNFSQQRALDHLSTTIEARLERLQQTLPPPGPSSAAKAQAVIPSPTVGLQDQVRAQIEVLEKEQQGLLAERLHARERATRRTLWALGAGCLFSATVLCIVFTKLNREITTRVNAQYYLRVAYATIDEAHRHLNGII